MKTLAGAIFASTGVLSPVAAAPSDCVGTSLDGQAVCSSPTYAPATYSLCTETGSYLYIDNAFNACFSELGLSSPLTSDSQVIAVTNCADRKLRSNAAGSGYSGPIPWAPAGLKSPVDNLCWSEVPSRIVNGHYVSGWAKDSVSSFGMMFLRFESPSCPAGHTGVYKLINGFNELISCKPPVSGSSCAPDMEWNGSLSSCVLKLPQWRNSAKPGASCPAKNPGFGDPIYPLTGANRESIDTGFGIGTESLQFTYDTARQLGGLTSGNLPSLGRLWVSSLHRNLSISSGAAAIKAYRGNGGMVTFVLKGGAYTPDADINDRIAVVPGGYAYTNASEQKVELYNPAGQLTSIADKAGNTLSFTYSASSTTIAPDAGYLIQVADNAGRVLRFEYALAADGNTVLDGRISKITHTNGRVIGVAYDVAGNLASITWPDGRTRQLLYENAGLPWALTGVIDENASRFLTFTYDAAGRATSTEQAGGVDRYSVSYATPPSMVVNEVLDPVAKIKHQYHEVQLPASTLLTQPTGQMVSLSAISVFGSPALSGSSQPAGSGCAAANNASSYDASGNLLSHDNFQGERSCYAYDGANRETVRVDGLATTVACSAVLPAGATLPSGARRTLTHWHPDWKVPARIDAPGRITSLVYHGQPDPFNNNEVANCATAANFANGKPLPLVCKRVEQATQDVNGASASTYDPYFGNVALLLRGDGADGSTLFVDSSTTPKAVTAGGNARISTAQSKFGGSSMYFDGVRDYITLPSSPSLSMGASDFTIEMWIYKLGDSANTSRLWNPDGDLYADVHLGFDANGNLWSYGSSTGTSWNSWAFATGIAIPNGVWKHVALVRAGGTVTLYVDGVGTVLTTSLGDTALYDPGGTHLIGGQSTGADRPFNGYIDDFRVTKGLARYTGPFAAPTATYSGPAALDPSAQAKVSVFTYDGSGRLLTSKDPLNRVTTYTYYSNSTDFNNPSVSSDPGFDSVSLLLHGDGADGATSFADSSLAPKVVTAGGNARVSTAQSKFGGSSLYFDGVRDYVSVPADPSLAMKSSDFTIEMWMYKVANNPNTSRLWNPDGDVMTGTYLTIAADGNLVSAGSSDGTSFNAWNGPGVFIPNNVWTHVALVRLGGTVTLYVDGVGTVLTTSLGATVLYDEGMAHLIGGQASGIDRAFNGYLDDFRVTKGLARYTANFTPPVQAFADTGPVLDPNAVGHTKGDLQSVTNAAGHVTQFTLYDRAGRARQVIDPNGVVTDTAYTPRGWVSSVTVTPPGGTARTTSYSYDNAGQMTGATLPDGATLGYSYDAAHRLTGVTDAKGNTVSYTLDAMGNKVGEQVKDPSGNLQRNITRVYDALNRVQQVTGAGN